MKKLISIFLIIPTIASAEFFTGNKLHGLLNGSNIDKIHALGYIQGVFDAYHSIIICAPATVNAGQVNDMIKNYLENTPAIRHRPADQIIAEALIGVWPCKDKGRQL